MPKGFLAQDGLHPEFAELYGIQKLVEDYCIDLFKILKESKVAKKAAQPKTEKQDKAAKDALPSMVLVSGNTYPIKDQIKAFGGKWDAESKSWWVPSENVKKVKELMNQ